MKLKFLALLIGAIAFALPVSAQNIFIKVVDNGSQVPGEAVTQGYANWSEVTGFNGGSTAEPLTSGPGGVSRPETKCFTVSMLQDKMAYALKRAMYMGKSLTSIQLDFTRMGAAGSPAVYYRLYMEDVSVTLLEEAAVEDNRSQMNIAFVPTRFRYTYWQQLPNGTMTNTPVIFGWNTTSNQPWN